MKKFEEGERGRGKGARRRMRGGREDNMTVWRREWKNWHDTKLDIHTT